MGHHITSRHCDKHIVLPELSLVCQSLRSRFSDANGAVMVASYLPSSYLISASILSNLGAHLISYLIYGCGLVSS